MILPVPGAIRTRAIASLRRPTVWISPLAVRRARLVSAGAVSTRVAGLGRGAADSCGRPSSIGAVLVSVIVLLRPRSPRDLLDLVRHRLLRRVRVVRA